ncbi:flagellar motor protein MotB [Sphingomonas spermidinifaciens]|uniref:Flagellar motor protein MotB n=1 Tax=Sphingomonas spermidinifaciens TaxID=1141889 RepID=A0A2A4B3G0_9SPHN|nr:flagellar motor protein MotB [Sphingomonas spermidinifaciens]PCD02482.1 flagellar motor protein MotB [Sphingomonas spermidinifaciens]
MNRFDGLEPSRPLWLVTLADLCLLLVGFFVFVQSSQLDRRQLAAAIRKGFDGALPEAEPITLDRAAVRGFGIADAATPPLGHLIGWAREAAADPRTTITVTGSTDGSSADRDPLTGAAPILAADRARGVAATLVRGGAISRDRIVISTDPASNGRHVLLSVGFAGGRQVLAARQLPLAAVSGALP